MRMRKNERAAFESGTLSANYGITYAGHTHLRESEYEELVRQHAEAKRAAATAVAAQPKR